ncbi:thrombospondin type 1 domain protein [Cooperia oncophora]
MTPASISAQSQTRYRTCSMATCVGTSSEARPCITYVQPQIAQWGEWGPWGACSASCGGGTCTRTRLCNNACTTCQCVGAATQTMSCNTQPCCEYGPWSPWSPCSVTCGTNGVTYRTRQCSCPEGCEGPANEQKVCNADQPCPPPLYEQQTPAPIVSPPTFCITCYLPQPPCITCINYAPFVYGYGRRKRQAEKLE